MTVRVVNNTQPESVTLTAPRDCERVHARLPDETSRISLIVPAALREALEALAARERRTLNAQVTVILERGLAQLGQAA